MTNALPRSPELMNADDTALLLIDVQERLAPAVRDSGRVVWNCGRLLEGAAALGVTVGATEQRPDKLGPTVAELASQLDQPAAKTAFSCRGCGGLLDAWLAAGKTRVLLAGIETHVCVQQTALDLLAAGLRVIVAVDAVGSRHENDHQVALRRMESSGVTLTTTEAALFEWCQDSTADGFKAISNLAKQTAPTG